MVQLSNLTTLFTAIIVFCNFFAFCSCSDSYIENMSFDAKALNTHFDNWKDEFEELSSHLMSFDSSITQGKLAVSISPLHDDSSLDIDYLYLPAYQEKTNLIIINSGIHGVEAPAGVFLQHYLLKNCIEDQDHLPFINRENTALLIIHIMNPFGAKYNRRFNLNNVDLNRNCFPDSISQHGFPGLSIDNPEYEDLQSSFESPISQSSIIWLGFIEGIKESIFNFIQIGEKKITKALSGQYKYPNGIFYGGNSIEKECLLAQNLMTHYIDDFKNVAIIDVHTGLGKKGINQIMTNPISKKEDKILQMMFPERECLDICEIQKNSSQEFYTTGDFSQWIYKKFPLKREKGTILSFTSEIGTFYGAKILQGIINENYCYWNRSVCGEERYFKERENLKILFNPNNKTWQNQVYLISKQTCKALSRFSLLN